MPLEIELIPICGMPIVDIPIDIVQVLCGAIENQGITLMDDDIVVIAHTLVSKAEGRIVSRKEVVVSERAHEIAARNGFDPAQVELALQESVEVIRDDGVLVTETHHGLVCNFSGVDRSNAPEGCYVLLPVDPDNSAKKIMDSLRKHFKKRIAVIITDTQGRPWRRGSLNVAIGCAGIDAFRRYRGKRDIYGRVLQRSTICQVDEIASAAEPLMGQADQGVPVVIVRGYQYEREGEGAREIPRTKDEDLFR